MPEAIRKCQVCRKAIPDDRHPRARTCSERCMKINYRQTQAEGSKRHRAKLKEIEL